ncbi:acetylcholine-gated cation-selective channel [Fragilaria crotonensis]|nr:acetylcholine-gated cation-selective channel [Fragilaria crotonensis]
MRSALVFVLCAQVSASFRTTPRIRDAAIRIDGLPEDFFSTVPSRDLQTANATNCSICDSFELLGDVIPPYVPGEQENLTCADWEGLVATLQVGSEQCVDSKEFFPYCCKGPPTYRCERQVRNSRLLGYDKSVPPIVNNTATVDVRVNLIFLTVTDLNVQKGTAEIFVWLELVWQDPRLAWSVNSFNCTDIVSMRASLNVQVTEIWVPDFDLLNVASGVQNFPDAMADVLSDGTVYWRRGGALKAICQYRGLAKIPFDHLGCQFIMGPWTRFALEKNSINYELADGVGFTFGDFTPTYNEFKLLPELVNTSKSEVGMLSYVFYFERATSYYLANIVVPTTLLTYVSFGTYLLDLRVGERLSFGMALTLVIVAQQIVTSGLLPVSNAYLWIDKYVSWSFYWVIFGLVESVVIGYLFFIREDLTEQSVAQPEDSQAPAANPEQHLVDNDDPDTPQESDPVALHEPDSSNIGQSPVSTLKQRLRPATFSRRAWMPTLGCISNWAQNVPLRRIDHICFFLATITYTIFVIVMFSTVPTWGANIDPVYE